MKKRYNLGSKADMKRFTKDLKQEFKQKAITEATSRMYDVTCPTCGASVKVPTGKSLCPKCRKEIDLKLDIKF